MNVNVMDDRRSHWVITRGNADWVGMIDLALVVPTGKKISVDGCRGRVLLKFCVERERCEA